MTTYRERTTELVIPPMTPPVADVLIRARAEITPEGSWKTGWGAEGPTCALGAIARSAGWEGGEDYGVFIDLLTDCFIPTAYAAASELAKLIAPADIGCVPAVVYGFNDTRTHKQVLELFDRAIEHCLKEGI